MIDFIEAKVQEKMAGDQASDRVEVGMIVNYRQHLTSNTTCAAVVTGVNRGPVYDSDGVVKQRVINIDVVVLPPGGRTPYSQGNVRHTSDPWLNNPATDPTSRAEAGVWEHAMASGVSVLELSIRVAELQNTVVRMYDILNRQLGATGRGVRSQKSADGRTEDMSKLQQPEEAVS